MFEKLLERILERILGQYIDGLSKDQMKVGVWSGNVDISNLRLKQAIITELNLPFELRFGMIENLKMKIPWKNLSGASIQVNIQGIYLLIVPTNQATWDNLEHDVLQNKQTYFLNYARTLVDTITEKLKMQGKEADKGYFGKLMEKVLNNLQISIKDIHIRLESVVEPIENLSFGLTLDSLNIQTCDENWRPSYVDMAEGGISKIVYKSLEVRNFHIYWNSEESVFLSETCKTQNDYFTRLRALIYNEKNSGTPEIERITYLFNFSTVAHLKQIQLSREIVDQKVPEFDVEIQLDTCNFNLSQNQIKQSSRIINVASEFAEFMATKDKVFASYKFRPKKRIETCTDGATRAATVRDWWKFAYRAVRVRVKPESAKMSWFRIMPRQRKEMKTRFNALFQQLLFSKEADPTVALNKDELLEWQNLICIFDQKQILAWIEEGLKTQKIQEQIQKEQSKKSGFLGLWGKTKEVSDDEEKKIAELLDQIMKQQGQAVDIPMDYPRFKIKFIQKRFNVSLTKRDLIESLKEEVFLQTKDIQIDVYVKKNGLKVSSSLKGIKLSYRRKDLVDRMTYDEELFFCDKTGESFFNLQMEDKPSEYPGLDKKIDLQLGSVNFIYNSRMIQSVTDIFKLEISEDATEKIRLNAKKKFREAKDIGEHAMRDFLKDQLKFIITINMKTPQIILPIDGSQLQNSACWIFYPGDLKIEGDTFQSGDMKEMYDHYALSLTDIQFVYCKKVSYALSKNATIEQIRSNDVADFTYVFRDFNIEVKIKVLKKIFVELNILDARIAVAAKLNALSLNLTPELVHELKNIGSIFMIEERNLKKREKRAIITGATKSNYLDLKQDNQVKLYYSVFYKNGIYFFENPKDEEKAKIHVDLEELPTLSFVNSENLLRIKEKTRELQIAFDGDAMYKSWKKIIEAAVEKIQKRLDLGNYVSVEGGLRDTGLTKEEEASKQGDENTVELQLDFVFDNLKVAIQQNKSAYLLDSESLTLKLTKRESGLWCQVELKRFALKCSEGQQEKYLLTSFYDKSLASTIFKNAYVQKQEQLLIVDYDQKENGGTGVASKKIKVLFGSLFVDFEPNLVSGLMVMFLAPSSENLAVSVNQDDSVESVSLKLEDQGELGPKALEIYEPSAKKFAKMEDSPVSLELRLEIQAINLLLINGIRQTPLMNIICENSSCELKMRNGGIEFQAEFFDLRANDLTNFPNTLTFRDIEKIHPSKFVGKLNNKLQQPLVVVKFSSRDAQLFNIDSSFVSNVLDVRVDNVELVVCLQPVLRVVGFMTDQMLPALLGELNFDRVSQGHVLINTNLNEKTTAIGKGKKEELGEEKDVKKEGVKSDTSYLARRKAYVLIHKPFWTKINVVIENTNCRLPINENSRIVAYIERLTVENSRKLNTSRICRQPGVKTAQTLPGIWNDEYEVNVEKIGLVLCQIGKPDQTLTSPMNLHVKAELPLFENEYDLLYKPVRISNYQNRHLETTIGDATNRNISPTQVIYDNAMMVDVRMSPFILRIGNFEYLSMMKCLDTCVLYNDGNDEIFVKDFVRKEQEKKPTAMVVHMKIDRIALVSLNNKAQNTVSTKIFLNDFDFTMVGHPNGDSIMSLKIQDLRGYHLLKNGNQYHEKGFIGELWVTRVHEPESLEQLTEMFLKDINEEGLGKPAKVDDVAKPLKIELTMEMTAQQKMINVKILKLTVLLQTDVLMELLGLIEQKEIESPVRRRSTVTLPIKPVVKKEVPMVVTLELSENSFLLPSAESEIVLVLRSNIALIYRANPVLEKSAPLNEAMFKSVIQGLSCRDVETMQVIQELKEPEKEEDVVVDNKQKEKMSVFLNLNECEVFMIKFIDFFREESSPASKRELILPFSTELLFNQYNLRRERVSELIEAESVNVNKVSLYIGKQIEVKYTVLDVELLLGIVNYQLVLMSKEEPKKKVPVAVESVMETQVAEMGLAMSYNYVVVKIDELKITLINDNSNIFAPVIIFKLKNFEFYADLELLIKVSVDFGFEGYYFNSEIFHWEPFVEPTKLKVEYETVLREGGVSGKVIKVMNGENASKLNINLSIAFLVKIKFLLDTWEVMKKKNEEEAEKAKNVKLDTYLKSIQSGVIKEGLRLAGQIMGLNKTSYISPIRITNTTGYPIVVRYYKKVINIRQGNPVLKAMNEKFVELKAGESKPFSADEEIEDYEDVQEKLRTNLSYKFISIQIQHPEFTINKIENVNVVINHSKKINLKGKEKNLSDYKIIYSSRTNLDIKEIMISSPMMFVNSLKEAMRIVILHPFGKRTFEVAAGGELYIPFDLVSYLFDIYVGTRKMVFKGKFESFYLKQTGHFLVLVSEDKAINFVLKVYQEVKFRYLAKLVAIPAVSFKNNLPVPISITLANHSNTTKKIDLVKEENTEFTDFDIGTCLKMSLTVPGFKPSDLITLIEMNKEKKQYKFTYPKVLRLVDIEGKETSVNLVRIRDGYSHFNYSIFCNVVLVNETPFSIKCNASEKFKMPKSRIGGQSDLEHSAGYNDKIVLVGGTRTFLNVSLGENENYESTQFSNTISTQGITSGVFQIPVRGKVHKDTEMFLEFGYSMRLFYLDQNDVTASKVIQLTPKTILYNHSTFEIKIESEDLNLQSLKPEEKLPLFLFKKLHKNQKLIFFSVRYENESYRTFTALDLNKVGTAIFVMSNERRTSFRIFKVEITLQVDYLYVTFADRTGHKDFSVVNKTEFDVVFHQVGEKDKFDMYLKSGESGEFGLVNPYAIKAIEVVVTTKGDHVEVGTLVVKLHRLTKELWQFKAPKKFNMFANLQLKEDKRQLTLSAAPLDAVADGDRKKTKKGVPVVRSIMGQTTSDFTTFDLKIKELGVSVIAKYMNQNVELFYVFLSEIRAVAILAEDQKEIQFVVKYLNVDSNYALNCKYPVLLTVSKSQESLKETNFFNFHVILNSTKNQNLYNIDLFEFEIIPLTFTAEFSLINAILAFKKQLDKIFSVKETSDYLGKYFRNLESELSESMAGYRSVYEWQTIEFKTSNNWIYCREFKMSLVKIMMTFNMSSYSASDTKESTEDSNIDLLIETFGVTFLNIDESPISFSGLKLESVFESMDAFTNIILNHWKDQRNLNIAKLVGSLDIIGNPVSLFSNLSSGVVEFFEKPVSGFVRGPVEGFYGIAYGSQSLIKNTAAGTFNTISKITSSLASGLTALSMDKEYLNKRNITRAKKPQNLIDGLGKGFVSIGKGFFSGITGVVSQPIKEVKHSGATGIFLGVFKGISGLVTKPLGAVFDATSQTAEGFKKTVTNFDDRANEKKIRVPRVFYSSLQYFKIYNADDSATMRILKTLDGGKYENDTFFDSIEVTVQENREKHFIVLTNENFLILRNDKSAVVLKIEIRDISRMKYLDENNMNIDYYVNGEKRSIQLNNEKENIFKIINTVNYCKYINHVDSI